MTPVEATVLDKIASTTQAYLSKFPVASSSRPCLSPPPHELRTFPDPPPLLHQLLAAGTKNDVAMQIDRVYCARAKEFKTHCETAVAEACSRIAQASFPDHGDYVPALQAKVNTAFTELYSKAVHSWMDKALAVLKDPRLNMATKHDKRTRPFNHEYLPLLEHFFEENPFPNHSDKAFLARKSGMTYRQIHVWFQNRRSRTKKEGKTLRRKSAHDGANLPLDNLLCRMGKYVRKTRSSSQDIYREQQTQDFGSKRLKDHITTGVDDTFNKSAPPHAFPAPYPPACSYDPFPQNYDHLRVLQCHWPRQPCSSSSQSPLSSNGVSDLIEKFSQMNVRSDNSARRCSPSTISNSLPAATSGITIRQCTAPHPALVRVPIAPKYSIKPLLTIPARPTQSQHIFTTPNLQIASGSFAATDKTLLQNTFHDRQVAPLPRRVPRSRTPSHHTDSSAAMHSSPSSNYSDSDSGITGCLQSRLPTGNIAPSLFSTLQMPYIEEAAQFQCNQQELSDLDILYPLSRTFPSVYSTHGNIPLASSMPISAS